MRKLDPDALGVHTSQIRSFLMSRVVGQTEAIEALVSSVVLHRSGLSPPNRPVASLLMVGPSGTGKTLVVETLAEALVGSPKAVIKIDCAEFQHGHEVARLMGAPPGYVGHRETRPLLCQEELNRHHTDRVKLSFVLFDEIEKASDALWNLLLGILDRATLTLGDGRRVDFSAAMIFMTGNVGARQIEEALHPRFGFAPPTGSVGSVEGSLRKIFSPEFRNRIDRVLVFRELAPEDILEVARIELGRINERLKGLNVRLTDAALERIALLGYRPEFGARHVKRALARSVVEPLARLIDSGQISGGELVVDWSGRNFEYLAP